ncbi:MAG: carboxylesterase family protein [Pseudomonadota bacterium]
MHKLVVSSPFLALLWACPDPGSLPLGPEDRDAGTLVEDAGADAAYVPLPAVDSGVVPQVDYQDGVEVELDEGRVRGELADDLRIFRGIPFAEPPVGALRFRPPVPISPWSGIRETREFGPACPQEPLPTMSSLDHMDEDCLNVNVWAHTDGRIRPVMVWIFGGAFTIGGGDWSVYEGSDLARNGDVVVMTFNYRLGALGYLATETLQASDPLGASGTHGILDQIELLRWVRRNAPAFGGDPYNVTIFGESAGGISVCALLAAPQARGLFRRSISQSGGGCNTFTYLDREAMLGLPPLRETSRRIVEEVGCGSAADEVACLQLVPAQDLVAAIPTLSLFTGPLNQRLSFMPAVDGVVIPEMPIARLVREGADPDVSAIFGSNADEAALFLALDTVPFRGSFRNKLEELIPDEATVDAVMALYPWPEFLLPKDAFEAFLGDVIFNCGPLAAASAVGDRGRVYYFTQAPLTFSLLMGTMHAIDTIYTFNTFEAFLVIPSAADREVSRIVQHAWSTLARTGRPALTVPWPAYAPGQPSIARIAPEPELLRAYRGGRCEALRGLGLAP